MKANTRRVVQAGQGLVEYALMLVLIAVVAIGGALFLGKAVVGTFSTVGSEVDGAAAGATVTPAPAPTPTRMPAGTPGPASTPRPTPTIDPDEKCKPPKVWVFDPGDWEWECKGA